MELRIGSSGRKEAEDEPTKGNLAGGCCFDFNKVCLQHLCRAETAPALPADLTVLTAPVVYNCAMPLTFFKHTSASHDPASAKYTQQQAVIHRPVCAVQVLYRLGNPTAGWQSLHIVCMQAQDHLFVVGTEEGHIHKCSQAYNSEYLQTYQGTSS